LNSRCHGIAGERGAFSDAGCARPQSSRAHERARDHGGKLELALTENEPHFGGPPTPAINKGVWAKRNCLPCRITPRISRALSLALAICSLINSSPPSANSPLPLSNIPVQA